MSDLELFEKGVDFFNSGQYFEAHEVWEDLWRVAEGPLKRFYQGMIQAAVGLHHLSHDNHRGAHSQITKSINHLSAVLSEVHSIDAENLIRQLCQIRDQMRPQKVRIVRLK